MGYWWKGITDVCLTSVVGSLPSYPAIWFSAKTLDEKSPNESWRVKLRKVSYHMSRFLVCSSALLGKPGSPGATGDLRDCITGVATLLDDSHGIRWPQWTVCEKQTCDFDVGSSNMPLDRFCGMDITSVQGLPIRVIGFRGQDNALLSWSANTVALWL